MPITFAGRFALSQRWAGPLAKRLQPLIKRVEGPPQVRNALDGVWLGAPLHPALTDVPVGAWTTALALDGASILTGDDALSDAADRVLAIGTLAALPAAATGLNDLRDLIGQSRQVAMVHALLNVLGLSLSSASLVLRRAGRRGLARGLSFTGYLISTSAAHLGGKLGYGLGIRVNRTVGETAPASFVPVLDAEELQGEELRQVVVEGVPVLVARSLSGAVCALANTCTHLGGPMAADPPPRTPTREVSPAPRAHPPNSTVRAHPGHRRCVARRESAVLGRDAFESAAVMRRVPSPSRRVCSMDESPTTDLAAADARPGQAGQRCRPARVRLVVRRSRA